jgi:hypothetical protein
VEFVLIPAPPKRPFPVDAAEAERLLASAAGIGDPAKVREALLKVKGCRPGPADSVDYVGAGLSYARLFVRDKAIHVENNCGPRDLLKLYEALRKTHPGLLILDVQSRQLHTAESLREWWAKPL